MNTTHLCWRYFARERRDLEVFTLMNRRAMSMVDTKAHVCVDSMLKCIVMARVLQRGGITGVFDACKLAMSRKRESEKNKLAQRQNIPHGIVSGKS